MHWQNAWCISGFKIQDSQDFSLDMDFKRCCTGQKRGLEHLESRGKAFFGL